MVFVLRGGALASCRAAQCRLRVGDELGEERQRMRR